MNFQNAYGKFFYQKLCQFLLPDTTLFDCLISTNPKGDFQPGAMCIEWVTPGRNMRSGSSGSASCSMVLQRQERVADFVVVYKKNTQPCWRNQARTRRSEPEHGTDGWPSQEGTEGDAGTCCQPNVCVATSSQMFR